MPPELIESAKWLGGLAIGLIAWFARKSLERVEHDLSNKADKSHTDKEIEGLKMELKESREARERDIERIERTSAEKFAEFAESMRDRMNSMERNVSSQIAMVLQAIRSNKSGD